MFLTEAIALTQLKSVVASPKVPYSEILVSAFHQELHRNRIGGTILLATLAVQVLWDNIRLLAY